MIPVLPPTPDNLRAAAARLAAGGLVAFPTETVYGLGGNALDPKALAGIFEAKRRPFFDPLIVHVESRAWLDRLCPRVDARAEKLMEKFWPGPLTLVLEKTDLVPGLATSGLPTVAVRMPAHPVAQALLRETGFPLAAPSANPFGRLSPTTAEHVRAHFADPAPGEAGVDLVLDGGPCAVGVESTIVSLAGETPLLLRAGGLAREAIEAVIGPLAVPASDPEHPQAPGQLASHYAPHTKTILLPGPATAVGRPRLGLLSFRGPDEGEGPALGTVARGYAAVEVLSPSGDPREAAANLFACLHRLDALDLAAILVEPVPEKGLGLAIMDRLRKASA